MADFTTLLSKPLSEVKRPQPLPAGTYFGVIKSWEPGESSQKKTPYVQFNIGFTHAGDDVDAHELASAEALNPLSKRQLNMKYYLSPAAEYRVKEFYESCGVEAEGRTHSPCLAEMIGKSVIAEVIQRPNSERPEDPPFNEIRDLKGAQ